ncbi:hypothetical protein ACLQ18_44380 [Streptomyces sp. DT193]|uniref:hypothetical protein n=1 Tax=Streptomyces sp. DT193 TaxID=3393418 RepID=UPI003CF85F1F
MLLFSDPAAGHRYGYYDGWLAQEDTHGPIFEYTGVGVVGDLTLERGNRAILNHVQDGRSLRVFTVVGTVEGSQAKLHRYVGEFKVDAVSGTPGIGRRSRRCAGHREAVRHGRSPPGRIGSGGIPEDPVAAVVGDRLSHDIAVMPVEPVCAGEEAVDRRKRRGIARKAVVDAEALDRDPRELSEAGSGRCEAERAPALGDHSPDPGAGLHRVGVEHAGAGAAAAATFTDGFRP